MEQDIVKNSIFKQKTFANVYFYHPYDDQIVKTQGKKELKAETLHTCKLAMPLLNKGELFYIEEIDMVVEIKTVVRTSKENVLYIVDSKWEDDTEENMEISYKQAQKDKDNYKQRRIKENEKYKKDRYDKETFWYKLFHSYEKYNVSNR